jgi:hypothetical protein
METVLMSESLVGSSERPCTPKEGPEGYQLFHYKDKTTKSLTHILDFQEYGVTKKWVIITEISKEVENNTIGRVNVYARKYVTRRNVASGGSNV